MAGAGAGCRCCLNNAVLKDIATEYYWMGDREVYAEMLHECFNIKLSQLGTHRGICDACIFRLRDAICFKRQVLSSEEQTLRHLVKQAIPKIKNEDTVVFKVERPDTSDSEDNIEDNVDDAHMDIEILDEVKGELNMDPKTDEMRKINVELSPKPTAQQPRALKRIHKRPAKVVERNATEQPGPSTSKKSRATSFAKTGPRIPIKIGSTTIKPMKKGIKIVFDHRKKCEMADYIHKNVSTIPDNFKEQINITAILHYSNVTPFTVKNFKEYVCFYCCEVLPDPQQLKEHTRAEHAEDRMEKKYDNVSNYDWHLNLDITDLQCTLCSNVISDLPSLKEHLHKVHDKKVFLEYNEKATPFKLTKTFPLFCAVCTQPFDKFKMLSQHMNNHYRNFVCRFCDAGFVIKQRLKNHERTHGDGSYPCSQCNKVFKTTKKLKNHIWGVHEGKWDRNKCQHCGKKFTNYDKRQQHLVDEHNEQLRELECNACELKFTTKRSLRVHTRRFHLQEKNYRCSQCEKAFFSKVMLDHHMLVHTGVRAFQCKVCHKSYGRRFTLREHMRIHNDDRRFACDECGKSFVQKCSLKGHIKTHHPEYALKELIRDCK